MHASVVAAVQPQGDLSRFRSYGTPVGCSPRVPQNTDYAQYFKHGIDSILPRPRSICYAAKTRLRS